jgi:hypothetical protein
MFCHAPRRTIDGVPTRCLGFHTPTRISATALRILFFALSWGGKKFDLGPANFQCARPLCRSSPTLFSSSIEIAFMMVSFSKSQRCFGRNKRHLIWHANLECPQTHYCCTGRGRLCTHTASARPDARAIWASGVLVSWSDVSLLCAFWPFQN